MTTNLGLVWRYASEPVSEKNLAHVEHTLGVKFPGDYRDCVKVNGGGVPEPSVFSFVDASGEASNRSLSLLISADPQESENLLETVDGLDIKDLRPEGLIPIINDGDGSYVCLDYRGESSPKIVYWSRGNGLTVGVFPLAASFTEFLSRLS